METLLPVIVGGIIGVLGGLAGPPVTHWLGERGARRKLRAEKLEQLICVLYDHSHWLRMVRSIRVFGEDGIEAPPPIAKAIAIAAIYAPEVQEDLRVLEALSDKYEAWMHQAALKRHAKDIARLNDGLVEAYKPYLAKLLDVVEKVRKCV